MGFFGSFLGTDQAGDLRKANKQATSALDSGYQQSQGYYNQAADSFDPYVQQGNEASTFYGNALGLNGDDARNQAQNTITSDPLWSGKFAQDSNAVLRNMNARGQGAGGSAALAGQRVLTQNYGNALDRYMNLGQQGFQATGAKAGVLTGQGDNAYGYGATKAGNAINYGNAMAANRSTGINNVLGMISAATGGYNALMNPGAKMMRG